ncbi:hypothetical protein [Terricaulis silvestris]|uniref:Uncharacterized protein n=1 Tax=Terricaulis silvestris TaxID=2686094 RepID=A0A6I6MGN7_9CAUL|nr:hypothetical protein [Terricaulis silvestris]QGZ93875.1 hypothetical protein DSM104635_00689 [Terricaulis silvestris]
MKSKLIIACAALALAACGQSTAPTEEAPAAPQSLMEQVQAMSGENQLVAGYSALVAYQQAHPEAQPPCTSPRGTESRGIVPADVAPDSVYAAHVGSLVLSVQCGVLISRAQFDPREHWLVVYAPAATEVAVVNCAGPNGGDVCPAPIPRAAAPAAPATP